MYKEDLPHGRFFYWQNMERKFITNTEGINELPIMADQVSMMIAAYNSDHPFEMLPKDVDIVISQLTNGLSVMITTLEGNPTPKVLFHGSLYPNFENGKEVRLGTQVIELGSWIVHPDYRGKGLGTEGVKRLLEIGRNRWDPVLFLSTHKREVALKVSKSLGLDAADYKDFPYLTYLTCTCTNCSESFGYESCVFRRKTSAIEVIGDGGKIDCSLVISDLNLAQDFETRCRELHSQINNPLLPGEISVNSMVRGKEFFEWIKTV